MRIKDGFILREIAGTWVVVPIAERVVEFNGLMTLSESGALLWSILEKGATLDELVESLAAEYKVDSIRVKEDVLEFTDSIRKKGLIV